jgi:hypothetical protein
VGEGVHALRIDPADDAPVLVLNVVVPAGVVLDLPPSKGDVGPAGAGKRYTMRVDPDFSLLSNGRKEAFVGFGFKVGNDFHFVGNKSDGATGLNASRGGV